MQRAEGDLQEVYETSLYRAAVTKVLALLFGVSISRNMPIRNAMLTPALIEIDYAS
jgi:hypothetical protein